MIWLPMEETFSPNQSNPPLPTLKQTKPKFPFSKLIYLIIFIFLILVILGLVYMLFFSPKLKKTAQSNPLQQASVSAKPKEDNFSVGYVNAPEGLNLRQSPNGDSAKILLLPNGTELQIISLEGDWYFVESQTKGFVAKEFVTATKPKGTILKTFKDDLSPFSFLYPEVYKISFVKTDTDLEYSFTSKDSFGGFKVETQAGLSTIGNFALKNYPGVKTGACSVQFAANRKECEELTTNNGTLYLLLVNTTLYKISYLKTEGGLLADMNNLVFYSLYFK